MQIIDGIKKILEKEKEIIFAYLYGSFLNFSTPNQNKFGSGQGFNDIDIAIYLNARKPLKFIADLDFKLSKALNVSPDIFDIKILNNILEKPDAFSLLYLERLFSEGKLIVNKDERFLGEFLERYSGKYREAEVLISEVQ